MANTQMYSLCPRGLKIKQGPVKPINIPGPVGQTWGNLLLGPYSLGQGVPLLRTHLFLYSKRKQYFSATGNFIRKLNG